MELTCECSLKDVETISCFRTASTRAVPLMAARRHHVSYKQSLHSLTQNSFPVDGKTRKPHKRLVLIQGFENLIRHFMITESLKTQLGISERSLK